MICFFMKSKEHFYPFNIHMAYFTHLYSLSDPLDRLILEDNTSASSVSSSVKHYKVLSKELHGIATIFKRVAPGLLSQ